MTADDPDVLKTAGGVYRAAAVQFDPVRGDKQGNLGRMLQLLEEVLATGVRLAVLPEMATTGYCWDSREEIEPYVEHVPGPSTDAISLLATKYDAYVVVGVAEVDPRSGAFFNTAVLIGPEGIQTKYRKTHSFMSEVRWAADGDIPFHVVDTPLGRLGLLICMDAEYPEPARVLALDGCDVVCFPANWGGEKAPSSYWMTRAWENGAYWIAANRSGQERGIQFDGGSSVIGPDGAIRERIDGGQGWAAADIVLDEAREARAGRLHARGARTYPLLLQNTYLWPNTFRDSASDIESVNGLLSGSVSLQVSLGVLSHASHDLAEFCDLISDAAAGTVDLVVASPLRLDGRSGAVRSGELPFPELGEVCLKSGIALVTAVVAEPAEGKQQLLLVTPDGYVRSHVEAQAGAGTARDSSSSFSDRLFRAPWGTLGVISGAELLIPEIPRCLAILGADVIAVSSAASGPLPIALGPTAVPLPRPILTHDDPTHWYLPRVRAAENNVWLAFAGPTDAASGVFGPLHYRYPRSEVISDGHGFRAWITSDETDARSVAACRTKPYLRMRQPHLYGRLVHAADDPRSTRPSLDVKPGQPTQIEV